MFNSDTVPVPRKGFQLEEMDGETLLYRHSTKKLIYLSESAAVVWKLCDGQRTAREIVSLLAEAYPEAREDVSNDVVEAIDNLIREGALLLSRQATES